MASLREVRAEHLLSIRDLARQAQVAPSSIYLIETGHTRPSFHTIRRVAAALDVEPATIDEFRSALEARKRPQTTQEVTSPA